MKSDIHPEYRLVVFEDASADYRFLTRSTLSSNRTTKWEDGNEYPLVSVEISSASHPFYTGKQKIVDTAGRVERFERRYARAKQAGAAADASDSAAEVSEAAQAEVETAGE